MGTSAVKCLASSKPNNAGIKVNNAVVTINVYITWYIWLPQGLIDSQTLLSEQRLRYHLEAKVGAESLPMILSANVTRGLGRKTSLSATLKNVFREAASFSGYRLLNT